MKKLLFLFFISIGCFGQLTRNSSGGGTAGVVTDSLMITKAGKYQGFDVDMKYKAKIDNSGYLKVDGSVFLGGSEYKNNPYFRFYALDEGIDILSKYVYSEYDSTVFSSLYEIHHDVDAHDSRISMYRYGNGFVFGFYNAINYVPYYPDAAVISPCINFKIANIAGDTVHSFGIQTKAQNGRGYMELGVPDYNCLIISDSGKLVNKTFDGENWGYYDVLNSKNTLSGTVYVKDTNNVIKSLTFTNGLLTASDLGEFAGVFESSETNLTMTNYKNFPDYAEFLEFQKYLNMKKQLAKK